jgi:putative alpha-1,2-mannosidase
MPWKTQELVRQHTSSENFRNAPVGINGNDDCGQTSAWYIFNSIGFYPVSPASGYYSIGAPQFPEIVLNLVNGKKLSIKAINLSAKNKYVQEVTFNGKVIKDHRIAHTDVIRGGALIFKMSGSPTE